MINHEYSEILKEIFTILGFTEEEKNKATEGFKKQLAFSVLQSLQSGLPQDQQEWLNENSKIIGTSSDPKLLEIQNTIRQLYTTEELLEKSRPIFRKLLDDYIEFMSSDLSSEEISQVKVVAERV